MKVYIGFDFSMNKPAMTIYDFNKFTFFIWPLNLPDKKLNLFKDSDVFSFSRNLDSISPEKYSFSQITLEHTKRSVNLANEIINDIKKYLTEKKYLKDDLELYISSEGLSFGSTGDAALNLATYKGVLLSKIYENFLPYIKGLFTYSPITIKSIAGCAGKKDKALKQPMINAFINDNFITHKFKDNLISGMLTAKTNYIPCVDDIVDSYWAMKTMLIKEKIIK